VKFKRLHEWESGETHPTVKQLEAFARTVHVPVGYLFLSQPPEEPAPIPDFRIFDGQEVRRPSSNLLDTIYACQERQSWYRVLYESLVNRICHLSAAPRSKHHLK